MNNRRKNKTRANVEDFLTGVAAAGLIVTALAMAVNEAAAAPPLELNLTLPADTITRHWMQLAPTQAPSRRVRLRDDGYTGHKKGPVSIENRGRKGSRTHITVGFPI